MNIIRIRKKEKTKNGAALEYASRRRRLSDKWQRIRRIAIYAGAGMVVVVLLLVIVLVPHGQAAQLPVQAKDDDIVAAAAVMPVVATEESMPTQASATPVPTTKRPVATTAPDSDETDGIEALPRGGTVPTSEPTATPTSDPTATPKPDPTATAKPDPTATPKPDPTATPKPDPTATPKPDPTATPKPDPTPEPADRADYFKVEADTYYNEVGYKSNDYEYTEDEWYVLAQLIDGEAGSQPTAGQIAVGNVVMNRVLASGYPGSDIITVVTAGSQFSGYSEDNVPNKSSKAAASAVLDDQVWTVPQHAFNFNSSNPEGDDWGSHTYYKRIGNHNFYIDEPGRGRCTSLTPPPALYKRVYKWPQYGCKPANRVYRIQYMLKALGYDVTPDKYFGEGTHDALVAFQSEKGLDTDGVAGPATINALISAFGKDKYDKTFD